MLLTRRVDHHARGDSGRHVIDIERHVQRRTGGSPGLHNWTERSVEDEVDVSGYRLARSDLARQHREKLEWAARRSRSRGLRHDVLRGHYILGVHCFFLSRMIVTF